ncbi:MAG: pilus assembly protein [Acidimicrobiia bacterium]|nr:pilus assembly protein [Acidimicrobiia bacterium]
MKLFSRLPIVRRFFKEDGENGVVLVLTSLAMVVLMGMAAFAIDLGWLYYKQLDVRKAAEASALAGVVHMPLPGCSDPVLGTEPNTVALELAVTHGYNHGGNASVATATGANCNQLSVTVGTTVETFFMRVFGRNSFSISETATAEQLPPLKLGSDEPSLGNDPERGIVEYFWAAINGDCELKSNGDPYSPHRVGAGCSGATNSEFRDPAYYYAVEVPHGQGGGSLTVQVYDGDHWHDNRDDYDSGNVWATGDRINPSGVGSWDLDFILYEPDDTPNNWTDNSTVAGGGSCFRDFDDQTSNTGDVQRWTTVCTVSNAQSGIYVLAVSTGGNRRAISTYTLRTTYNGNFDPPNNPVQLYGLGALSLDMRDPGATPTFKIAKLEEQYANSDLIIGLYDVGDVYNGTAWLRFGGEVSGMDCEISVNGGAWGSDDSPGSAPCEIEASGQRYNGDWIELKFAVPPTYTCSGDCWVNVQYTMSATADVTERTTWTATVNGQPIHLVP